MNATCINEWKFNHIYSGGFHYKVVKELVSMCDRIPAGRLWVYVQFQNLAKENATYEKKNFVSHKTKAIFIGKSYLLDTQVPKKMVHNARSQKKNWTG